MGGHTIPTTPKIQITQKIIHPGEINKARYMPQNPDLIATKCTSGEILMFDRTKHSSEPERNGQAKPDIRLVGQQKEGYVYSVHPTIVLRAKPVCRFGLSWSPLRKGHILGGSEDMTVCLWCAARGNRFSPLTHHPQGPELVYQR